MGFKSFEIDEVVLVGGLICLFKVQEIVKEVFGKELYKGVNLDEVVVFGAVV